MNTIIEKIRAEVDKLPEKYKGLYKQFGCSLGFIDGLDEVKKILSDLEKECEEKPTTAEGLEEEIRSYLMTNRIINHSEMGWKRWGEQIARHFAQWGAEHRGSSETPKDLEEAAMNYIAPIENEDGLKVINFSGQDIKDAFIAGAKWQKEQDLGKISRAYENGATFGMRLQKEQMMKEAVEGTYDLYPPAIFLESDIPEEKHGQKVKLIIVKED